VRDPLSQTVHLRPIELLAYGVAGVASEMVRRAAGRRPVSKPAAGA
jgi:hydroxysqualene synthase